MSQKINNGSLVDKQGKVYHGEIDGYLVSHYNHRDNYRLGILVFEESSSDDKIDRASKEIHGNSRTNLSLVLPEGSVIKSELDMDKFKLEGIEYGMDDKVVFTYFTYSKEVA
jgi:hypothetical protein